MFSQLPEAKQDPIMALMQDYLSNTNPKKVNLGIGLYYDAMGKIPLLPSVDAAQIELGDAKKPHTYPPIEGLPEFTAKAQALLFGKTDSRIVTIQTLGGSGALTLGASFLHDLFPKSDI